MMGIKITNRNTSFIYWCEVDKKKYGKEMMNHGPTQFKDARTPKRSNTLKKINLPFWASILDQYRSSMRNKKLKHLALSLSNTQHLRIYKKVRTCLVTSWVLINSIACVALRLLSKSRAALAARSNPSGSNPVTDCLFALLLDVSGGVITDDNDSFLSLLLRRPPNMLTKLSD